MTPKEKAEELYDKYFELGHLIETDYAKKQCKKCALICVEEIIIHHENAQDVFIHEEEINLNEVSLNYWQEVKNEIEKL